MSIPDFNSYGFLPEGVHNCTLPEIKAQFCWNPHRTILLENLIIFLRHQQWIKQFNCPIFIDGSFVRQKQEPDDIDLVIDISKAHNDAIKEGLLIRFRHDQIKAQYGLDVWLEHPAIPESLKEYFQYLGDKGAAGTTLTSRHKKGILRIWP